MDAITDNIDLILRGFGVTLALFFTSAVLSLTLGTLLAAMRVAPVRVLRMAGTAYVTIFRNTPLLVLLILTNLGLPVLEIRLGFFYNSVLALGLYTAAFVCEAVRSGINSVDPGQAEAARSVGMSFGQSLQEIVLPQAFRSVIPPLASVLIAQAKNTSVAAVFGVAEATYRMRGLLNDRTDEALLIFLSFALGYILIVFVISSTARFFETRLRVAR